MPQIELVAEKTAAETAEFSIGKNGPYSDETWLRGVTQVAISAAGLAGGEELSLKIIAADGTKTAVTAMGGDNMKATATDTAFLVKFPGYYEVAKPITAATTSVTLSY